MPFYDELKALYPNASEHVLRHSYETGKAGVNAGSPREVAKLEPDTGHGTVGAVQVQAGRRRRFLVRVTSYRHRLLDIDNLCEKYLVDLCRYAGVIPDDAPGTTAIEVSQQKVPASEAEQTLIEVFEQD